jgi:hypothetical protein
MRRKLYFMLENIDAARRMMQELLLARIDDKHMGFYAKSRELLGDLPETSVMDRTYVVRGALVGFLIYAALGFLSGLVVVSVPDPWFPSWYVPASAATIITTTTVIGAIIGGIWTALVSLALPHELLQRFRQDIDNGRVLMVVRVEPERCAEIRDLVTKRYPQATYLDSFPKDYVVFP